MMSIIGPLFAAAAMYGQDVLRVKYGYSTRNIENDVPMPSGDRGGLTKPQRNKRANEKSRRPHSVSRRKKKRNNKIKRKK